MIEQSFNYADSTVKEMTDFFEIRVENLEHKIDKKKSSAQLKKKKEKNALIKRKRGDYNSSILKSSIESFVGMDVARNTSYYMDNATILRIIAMIYRQ